MNKMARTITEIQEEIIAQIEGDSTLSEASSGSATAIWRLITRIVATAIYSLEVIYDLFKADLIAQVTALRPHTLQWYQQKALDFQYGSDLVEGTDTYDNSALTPAQIATQKIVEVAAAVETNGAVKVKVAKRGVSGLEVLAAGEYSSLVSYFSEIKDAGVELQVINDRGDDIKMEVDVYYDPLVLDDSGDRIDGTATNVIQKAIEDHLENLPFNGILVRAHLTDALQAVDGVYVPVIKSLQCGKDDAATLSEVEVQYQPFAGFISFDDVGTDLTINYISKETL